MQHISDKFTKANKGIVTMVLALFILHFMSIHGIANVLVFCFEENGEINIESEVGSIFSIPSEDIVHAEDHHDHEAPTINTASDSHHDVALSQICSKEQRVTRFDQDRTLNFLDGILYSTVEDLPRSRVFQLVSYIPPLIEDAITASLTTVVRILYH